MVQEAITVSLASLSPFSILFAVHRINLCLSSFLLIWLPLSNRREGRFLKKPNWINAIWTSTANPDMNYLVSFRLSSSKHTPAWNMLLSFQCDTSDSCYPLKSLAEFISGKLVMQFICIPIFLSQPTLLFHISCQCEVSLQFIIFYKLILVYNPVLQHMHSSSQPVQPANLIHLRWCRLWQDAAQDVSVLALYRSRLDCQPMKSLRGLGKSIRIVLECVPRLSG